jgi:hypothetical protein
MGFAMRLRRLVVHGVIIGALALAVILGFGTHDASAYKSTGIVCTSVESGAIYAANQSFAAGRRGDTESADWWWSVYTTLEAAYVKGGCLDDTAI